MSAIATALGFTVFAVGLIASFMRNRLRGRLVGLGGMAGGALVVLVASAPTTAGTWLMAATGGVTLAGLLAFGVTLARWTAQATGGDAALLDDEPG